MLLTELPELYVAKRLKSGSSNTVRLYKHTITSFAKSLGKIPELTDLTDELIERHMWAIVNQGGAPESANKDRGQLIALWNFAAKRGMISTWPDNRPLPEPEKVPLGWLPEELERLFAACDAKQGKIGTVDAALWWRCLIRVLMETGERIGAIRFLKKSAVQQQWLLVPAHLRKGKRRDRLYELQPETLSDLQKLISQNTSDKQLFPWDRCETYLYNRYNDVLESAGLPTDRRSKFHRLRRTVASAVAREGGDASAALDHASPRTTKKYLDPRIVGREPVSAVLARYLANPELSKKGRSGQSKKIG
ncbi:MAG: tyrosine-type recombinase/integrase [Aureliella sp.]